MRSDVNSIKHFKSETWHEKSALSLGLGLPKTVV